MTGLPSNRFRAKTVTWRKSFDVAGDLTLQSRALAAEDQLREFSNTLGGGKLKQFKPLQKDVIVAAASANSDQNVVVHMRTGGGKSLIYQTLAALNEDGLITLVIGPLKALRMEQVKRARELGIQCVELLGGRKTETEKQCKHLLQNSDCTLLFLTPEMLHMNKDVRSAVMQLGKDCRLARAVIDEAHYVASTDEEFRPDYHRMGPALAELKIPQLLLTATMTPHILTTLIDTFNLVPSRDLFFQGTVDDSLGTHVVSVHTKSAGSDYSGLIAQVKTDLAQTKDGVGIVFCLRKADSSKLCDALQEQGIDADFYHSKRTKGEQDDVKERWHSSELRVVCATEYVHKQCDIHKILRRLIDLL